MNLNSQVLKINKEINKCKNFKELFDIPWKLYKNKKCSKSCAKNIKICILNTPCNGFGDLMFAHKLANMLREIYGCRVDIATTLPDKLMLIGEKKQNILFLKPKRKDWTDCRKFQYLGTKDFKIKYDLLFVAPVNQDNNVDYLDVKKMLNYSNRFNTFFFSEYQDLLEKEFDFPTGVGPGYF